MTGEFDKKIQESEHKYLHVEQDVVDTPTPGQRTNKLLEQGSLFAQPQAEEPKDKRGFLKKAITGVQKFKRGVEDFNQNAKTHGSFAAVANTNWANRQPEQKQDPGDPNSLFAGSQSNQSQPAQKQAQQQTQKQAQQQGGGAMPSPQIQQQFNALPPDVQKAYGNVRTYENIKKLEQQHGVKQQ